MSAEAFRRIGLRNSLKQIAHHSRMQRRPAGSAFDFVPLADQGCASAADAKKGRNRFSPPVGSETDVQAQYAFQNDISQLDLDKPANHRNYGTIPSG